MANWIRLDFRRLQLDPNVWSLFKLGPTRLKQFTNLIQKLVRLDLNTFPTWFKNISNLIKILVRLDSSHLKHPKSIRFLKLHLRAKPLISLNQKFFFAKKYTLDRLNRKFPVTAVLPLSHPDFGDISLNTKTICHLTRRIGKNRAVSKVVPNFSWPDVLPWNSSGSAIGIDGNGASTGLQVSATISSHSSVMLRLRRLIPPTHICCHFNALASFIRWQTKIGIFMTFISRKLQRKWNFLIQVECIDLSRVAYCDLSQVGYCGSRHPQKDFRQKSRVWFGGFSSRTNAIFH